MKLLSSRLTTLQSSSTKFCRLSPFLNPHSFSASSWSPSPSACGRSSKPAIKFGRCAANKMIQRTRSLARTLQQIVQQSEVSRSSHLHSWRTLWGSTQFGSIPKELKEESIWSQRQQVRHAKVNGSEVNYTYTSLFLYCNSAEFSTWKFNWSLLRIEYDVMRI